MIRRHALPLLALFGVALLPAPADPPPGPLTFPPEKGELLVLPLSVTDGDTIKVAVLVEVVVRLDGINAPELHGPTAKDGAASKAYLASILPAVPVRATFRGREKYGRSLATVYTADGKSLSQMMIDAGRAVKWDGTGPRP